MNPLDHSLKRLLKAAAQAPKAAPGTTSFTLEARVLAQWRAAASEDEFPFLMKLFRHAVIYASLVMLLSIGWNYLERNRSEAASMTALADYAMTVQLPP
jgi:hypothetical protein